jgi:hypothetical protein
LGQYIKNHKNYSSFNAIEGIVLNGRLAKISDGIVVAVNTFSILLLLWVILANFIRSSDGTYMTWIQIVGYGGAWEVHFGLEIIPLIALATVFLVTQIYLNVRLIQKNSNVRTTEQEPTHAP